MSSRDEEREAHQRLLKIWLMVALPPMLMGALSVVLANGPLFFIAMLWSVGAVAIALGSSARRRIEARPPNHALPAAPVPNTGDISTAIVRVAAVKAEYGALRSDIVYRIENSALFDDASPVTREFQLALMRWADVEAAGDAPTLQRVASEVELSFRTAKSNAETLGLAHLPTTARTNAERALKAAHLAERAASESEREAALAHVARLLDSIALYYLPSPAEVPKLGGPRGELGS